MRTSGDPECTSPITSATASSVLAPLPDADALVANPWIRKCPQRVGKSADATCFTFKELTTKLYRFDFVVPFRELRSRRKALGIAWYLLVPAKVHSGKKEKANCGAGRSARSFPPLGTRLQSVSYPSRGRGRFAVKFSLAITFIGLEVGRRLAFGSRIAPSHRSVDFRPDFTTGAAVLSICGSAHAPAVTCSPCG